MTDRPDVEVVWSIYMITNRANGKKYIGQTVDVQNRWNNHRFASGDCPALHGAIKKYGVDAFDFNVVEVCRSKAQADEAERTLIRRYHTRSYESGYNITNGGDGVSGWRASPETRERMRLAHLGNRSFLGRHLSAEHRAKLSVASKGRRHTPEARAKMSVSRKPQAPPMLGKKHSEETKAKMRASAEARKDQMRSVALGRKHTEETKAKIREGHLGRKVSEDGRERMRAAARRRECTRRLAT